MSQFDNIPEELRRRNQWLNWREQAGKDGKPTKVPHGTDGKPANVTDPNTYMTFEEAVSHSDKIGFAFTPDDPYTGTDLDHCRDPETGEVESWALEIVHELGSYTEVSPSGTGLHMIVKGEVPPAGNRKGRIEMYDRGRYFCMTGNPYDGSPPTIEERQEVVNALHAELFPKAAEKQRLPLPPAPAGLTDDDVLAKARAAKNGAEFDRLWQGDTDGYQSPSEADLALCCHLAFWCGCDQVQMDRLFRLSGLMREKWDQHRGEKTYAQMTIERAISGCQSVYVPPGPQDSNVKPSVSEGKPRVKCPAGRISPRISNLGQLDQVKFPSRKWVVNRLLPVGLSLLVGAPKMGKSWLALQLALMLGCSGFVEDAEPDPAEDFRVNFPSDFLGFPVAYGRVLYLALEDSERRLQTRARALMRGALPDSVSYATEWNLLHDGGLEDIQVWVDDTPDAKLVILDTFGRLRKPTTQYSYDRDVHDLKDLQRLALDRDVGILLVHHKRKGGDGDDYLESVSGTTAIAGTCDTILSLSRPRGEAVGALQVTGRDVEEQAFRVRHVPDNGRWVYEGPLELFQLSQERREIVELLESKGPLSPKQVADNLKKNVSTTTNLLIKMVSAGNVKKAGHGKYAYNPVENVENVENLETNPQEISTPSMFSTGDGD
jgi:hypothetical protein